MGNQYFENNDVKSNKMKMDVTFDSIQMSFVTDHGVFAKGGLDFASKLLCTNCKNINKETKLVDLGCGYGFIGVYLAKKFDIKPVFIDISKRACELTEENIKLNKVEGIVINYDSIPPEINNVDFITLNPPIHAGKEVIFKLYNDAKEKLAKNGKLCIVINKKHGAASHKKFLEETFGNAEIIDKDKQFFIIECKK